MQITKKSKVIGRILKAIKLERNFMFVMAIPVNII